MPAVPALTLKQPVAPGAGALLCVFARPSCHPHCASSCVPSRSRLPFRTSSPPHPLPHPPQLRQEGLPRRPAPATELRGGEGGAFYIIAAARTCAAGGQGGAHSRAAARPFAPTPAPPALHPLTFLPTHTYVSFLQLLAEKLSSRFKNVRDSFQHYDEDMSGAIEENEFRDCSELVDDFSGMCCWAVGCGVRGGAVGWGCACASALGLPPLPTYFFHTPAHPLPANPPRSRHDGP